MKRDFVEKLLKDNGIENPKELVDAILSENGKDIEAAKKETETLTAERDKLKEQLDEATQSLEKFKDIKPDELNAEIEKLKKTIEDKDKEHADKIADMEFHGDIDEAIKKAGAKNAKAVKALLDLEALKASKNRKEDINAALEAMEKENDYLFGSSEPINNPSVGSTRGGSGTDAKTATLMAAAGLSAEDEK